MKSVIVLDDNPMHADMARKVVQKASPDVDVRKHTDPFIALSDALESPPDLIVLDFMMPKMDGIQLLRELRKKGIMSKAVLVSAFMKRVSENLLPENHVAALVEKPYSTKEFLETIRSILEKPCVSGNGG
jgi:DNA-binding response OmpR family regulator